MTEDTIHRPLLLIDLWYPARPGAGESSHSYGFGRGTVAENVDPATGTHPLVVLSHGAMGASRNYSCIAEYLARQGFIVAGVSHFGESFVYGPETIDPAAAAAPWLRPRIAALSLIFSGRSSSGRHIDPARIGAIGHSSGGATVIALGGAVFDPGAMREYCQSPVSRVDRGCGYGRTITAPLPRSEEAAHSFFDQRVSRRS
jgi:predicted dienelactone hydrolase